MLRPNKAWPFCTLIANDVALLGVGNEITWDWMWRPPGCNCTCPPPAWSGWLPDGDMGLGTATTCIGCMFIIVGKICEKTLELLADVTWALRRLKSPETEPVGTSCEVNHGALPSIYSGETRTHLKNNSWAQNPNLPKTHGMLQCENNGKTKPYVGIAMVAKLSTLWLDWIFRIKIKRVCLTTRFPLKTHTPSVKWFPGTCDTLRFTKRFSFFKFNVFPYRCFITKWQGVLNHKIFFDKILEGKLLSQRRSCLL